MGKIGIYSVSDRYIVFLRSDSPEVRQGHRRGLARQGHHGAAISHDSGSPDMVPYSGGSLQWDDSGVLWGDAVFMGDLHLVQYKVPHRERDRSKKALTDAAKFPKIKTV